MVNNLGDKLLPVKPWCPKVEIRSETSSDTHALMSLAEGTIKHQIVVISYTLLQFCFAFQSIYQSIYIICIIALQYIYLHHRHPREISFRMSPAYIMAGEKSILVTTSMQMYEYVCDNIYSVFNIQNNPSFHHCGRKSMQVAIFTIFSIFKISPPCIILGGRCMQVTIFTIFSIFKISPPCIIVGGRRMQVTPDSG